MADEYIRAASNSQLSSPQSQLLATLLAEEDQHDYNQLLKITLPQDILHILHQVTFHLHSQIHSLCIFTLISSHHFSYFHHQLFGQL